jgi:FMN phosphatase YigB (HAD superfamily)
VLTVSHFLLEYPFDERLFPNAIEVVNSVKRYGIPVILSDGDVVFQPHKIRRSGLYDTFAGGAVLVYVQKEFELEDVTQRYPADHYVLVDDKLRILAAVKETWGGDVTSVFVRQGHYARDQKTITGYPPADYAIERIADFVKLDFLRTSEDR